MDVDVLFTLYNVDSTVSKIDLSERSHYAQGCISYLIKTALNCLNELGISSIAHRSIDPYNQSFQFEGLNLHVNVNDQVGCYRSDDPDRVNLQHSNDWFIDNISINDRYFTNRIEAQYYLIDLLQGLR